MKEIKAYIRLIKTEEVKYSINYDEKYSPIINRFFLRNPLSISIISFLILINTQGKERRQDQK